MQNWLQSITITETALSINIIHTLSIGSVCNYSGTVALASNMQNSIDKWKKLKIAFLYDTIMLGADVTLFKTHTSGQQLTVIATVCHEALATRYKQIDEGLAFSLRCCKSMGVVHFAKW